MMKRILATSVCLVALLPGTKTHAGTVQADSLGGILEVELRLTATAPSGLTVIFPAISSLAVAERTIYLPRVSGTGTSGIYRASVNVSRELPFVNHPDQWDDIVLNASKPTSVPFTINRLRVTYQILLDSGAANHHNFVRITDTPDYAGARLESWMRFNPNGFPYGNSITITQTTMRGWFYSLKNEIKARREETARQVFQQASYPALNFAALPLGVREAMYDLGQSGTTKLANGAGGHCSITQAFYQCNYTVGFMDDFPGDCQCNASGTRCWGVGTPWPYPDGYLNQWGGPLGEGRRMGRIKFEISGQRRVGIDATRPIERVTQTNGNWVPNGSYTPKAGDMFWRMENCWHLSTNAPAPNSNSIPHAMTLVGPIREWKNSATGDIRIEAVVFDGSSMINVYDFWEPNNWLNETIGANGFDTAVGDPDRCLDPNEVAPDNVPAFDSYSEAAVNKKYCRYCGTGVNPCPLSNLYCQQTQGWYFRRDYFIGESYPQ